MQTVVDSAIPVFKGLVRQLVELEAIEGEHEQGHNEKDRDGEEEAQEVIDVVE